MGRVRERLYLGIEQEALSKHLNDFLLSMSNIMEIIAPYKNGFKESSRFVC